MTPKLNSSLLRMASLKKMRWTRHSDKIEASQSQITQCPTKYIPSDFVTVAIGLSHVPIPSSVPVAPNHETRHLTICQIRGPSRWELKTDRKPHHADLPNTKLHEPSCIDRK